jgi:hypothetical protein
MLLLKSGSVPKIFFTNTSYEYWGRAASLIHTTADGRKDIALSPNLRVYFLAGLQHFSGGFPPQKSVPGSQDYTTQQRQNPNPIQWYWRALIMDMDQWVRDGKEPPASVYPRIADKTLVPLAQWRFPMIPGVNTPHEVSTAYLLNFQVRVVDANFGKKGSVSPERKEVVEPPVIGGVFNALVPQSDVDGNDLGGVRLPELQAPLATYTGWNLRDPSIGAPEQRVSFLGSWIPLTKRQRNVRSRVIRGLLLQSDMPRKRNI